MCLVVSRKKGENSLQDKNFSATFEIRFTQKSRFSRFDNPDVRINMRETQLDRCFKNKDTSNIAVVCFVLYAFAWTKPKDHSSLLSFLFFYTGFPRCIFVLISDNNATSDASFRKEKTLETRLSSQIFSPKVSSTRLLVARVDLYLGRFKGRDRL